MNQQSPNSKRALLLINHHARRGKIMVPQAIKQLQSLGFDLIEESIENPKNLPDTIRRYKEQVDLVIIGGGDGTLNAAADALVETQLPLGILPLGTANDLARTLQIPTSVTEACQVIANGQIQRIDLGWVNGKHFFNVASMGLSVQITRQLNKETKRRWGVLAYGVTAIKVIWQARPFKAKIRIGDESIEVKTIQIAIGNGCYYGGGMKIAADATIDDRRLDLYSLETRHWWQIISLLPAMWQGIYTIFSGVRDLHGQEIEIITSKRLAINTDGELTTYTPAKFRVIPKALSVFIPREA